LSIFIPSFGRVLEVFQGCSDGWLVVKFQQTQVKLCVGQHKSNSVSVEFGITEEKQ